MLLRSRNAKTIHPMSDTICPSSAISADVMAKFCERLQAVDKFGKAARIYPLIQNGAWTDAALALVEIELPDWQVRRLVFEDGKWLCSLSRHANLPMELDDTVDSTHVALPLAIVGAVLEARNQGDAAPEGPAAVTPRSQLRDGDTANFYLISVDNFG